MSNRKLPRRGPSGASLPSVPRPRGSLWLYGRHAVLAALRNPERRSHHLLAMAAVRADLERDAGAAMLGPDLRVETVERARLDTLLPGVLHQGVALETEPLPAVELEEAVSRGGGPVVVLDQMNDGRNLGAILRSAAAFGALAVVLPRDHAPPIDGVVAKAASGALEALPIVSVANLARALAELKDLGFWCVGLDATGTRPLAALGLGPQTALVLGSEGRGLRRLTRERCDDIAHLPTRGAIRSLNVSNAAAVALYEVARAWPAA
ncbi:MAG: 23S rRNA (guanosine(2251)-2'-O)-methyltransferase RlmB [Alphaproteobacteria bacterium]|nr:23S rRNA (guanosine(2251)-2'-O)-methyltransferase RlmB [Alphaproteobacteria bacterium]